MEDPVKDIDAVLSALCQGSPDEQQAAVKAYFLPDAAFAHPFCRVPRVASLALPLWEHVLCSRDAIGAIYRWYRFLSPRIEFQIESRAYDKRNHVLYLAIRQRFAIWFIPFYSANVRLVTEIHLSEQLPHSPAAASGSPQKQEATHGQQQKDGAGDTAAVRPRYFIVKQEDHYQVNEYLRFVLPVVGPLAWTAWQLISSLVCILLTLPLFILDRTSK